MAKLRKMLGDVRSDVCIELMALISSQNRHTIEKWAVGHAAEKCLPIFERERPGEGIMRAAIMHCREYFAGEMPLKELKPFVAEARRYASGEKGDVAQAAARAIATACASVQTLTNAFGFTMYAAAASAYAELGLDRQQSEYDAFAEREMQAALESFRKIAVENEPDPVNLNWNC